MQLLTDGDGDASEPNLDDEEDEEERLLRQINMRSSKAGHMDDPSDPALSLRELKAMKRMFDEVDAEGMTQQEFVNRIGPEFIRISPSATNRDIEMLFKRIDANANGAVDWDEFASFLLMNDVKATLKLTAEAKSIDFAALPSTRESQIAAHHALRHLLHKEPIHRLLVHPKHSKYFSGAADGMVKVWNAETLRHQQTLQAASNAAVTDMNFTPWNDTLAVTAMDNTISLYSCDSGDLVRCYQGERATVSKGGRIRPAELFADAKVRRLQFSVPVNRVDGDDIKYGRAAPLFGKVETTVPVLAHFDKPKEVPAVPLAMFGSAIEGRTTQVPIQAGYPSAIEVAPIRGEMLMFVGFDNGYLQLYPLRQQHHLSNTAQFGGEAIVEHPKNTIRMHWDHVSRIICVPQLDFILSASYDGMIQMRTYDRMEEVNALLGEGVVTNDPRRTGGPSVAVHDTQQHGHAHRITSMDWNYENRLIASCAPERDVLIWSPYIHKPVTKLPHPKGLILSAHFVKSSDQILTLATDHTVRLWDIRTYRCVQTLVDPSGERLSCASYDQRRDCVVLGSHCVRSWGLVQASEYHRKYTGHRRPVLALAMSLPFRQVITADHKLIVVWDLETFDPVMRWEVDCSIADMCLDTKCRRLFVAIVDGSVQVYNYINGLLIRTINPGGIAALRQHYAAIRQRTRLTTHDGTEVAAAAQVPSSFSLFAGAPEVSVVRFAEVSRPRPASVVIITLDDGLTSLFLDEEGADVPFRIVQLPSTSLTSYIDSSYGIVVMGLHGGISCSFLDEGSSVPLRFTTLPDDAGRICLVALYPGPLVEEPILKTRRYLMYRDAVIHTGSLDSTLPLTSGGRKSPPSGTPNGTRSPEASMSKDESSAAATAAAYGNRAKRRRSSNVSKLSEAKQLGGSQASPRDHGMGIDLDQRQLQLLGLVEAIVVMTLVEPHLVVTGSSDGLIQFWDARALRELMRFRATACTDAITCLCMTHHEDALLVGDNSGYVSIFDLSAIHDESYSRSMEQSRTICGSSAPLPAPRLHSGLIQLRVRFRAHNEAVSSIGLDEGLVQRTRSEKKQRQQPASTSPRRLDGESEPAVDLQRQSTEIGPSSTAEAPAHRTGHGGPQMRRRSFFTQEFSDEAATVVRVTSDDALDDTRRSPSRKSTKPRLTHTPSIRQMKEMQITPTGTFARLFTTSADSYSNVWMMNRHTCETHLVGCLGEPLFEPTLLRHHPQTLLVYDTVRCRLIDRYIAGEGKCTWGMISAHYVRVVENRRVSVFSSESIAYTESVVTGGGSSASGGASGGYSVDSGGSDDEDSDDLYDNDSPSTADLFDAEARSLARFSNISIGPVTSTSKFYSPRNSNPPGVAQGAKFHAASSTTQQTGRQLLKNAAYLEECRKAFHKKTYDDLSLESLLKRLLAMMSEGPESTIFNDERGFYCPKSSPLLGPDPNAGGGAAFSMKPAALSIQRNRLSGARRETAVVSSLREESASIIAPSSRDQSTDKRAISEREDVVHVVRPPRHLVPYHQTTHVHDPVDIADVLADPTYPQMMLSGCAQQFTGVRSVLRETPKHPFVTPATLGDRGEAGYATPRGRGPSTELGDESKTLIALGTAELERNERGFGTVSAPETPLGPCTFLTDVKELQARRDFMKSVMSFQSSSSVSGGTSPRLTSTSASKANSSMVRRPPSLMSEGSQFRMPKMPSLEDSGGEACDATALLSPGIPRLTHSAEGGRIPVPEHCANGLRGENMAVAVVDDMKPSSSAVALRTPHSARASVLRCRDETVMLDMMLDSARRARDDTASQSRKFHGGTRPTWEASEFFQRQTKRVGTSGGYVVVRDEDVQREIRQHRTMAGGMMLARARTVSRKPQVTITTEKDRELRAQEHLNAFRQRAVAVIGEESVLRRHDGSRLDAGAHDANSDGERAPQEVVMPTTRRPVDLQLQSENELLGDLQWVSRLHSKLDVPRTFDLVPEPESLEKLRMQDQLQQRLRESDVDVGWLRLLSTGKTKRPAPPSAGSGSRRGAAKARRTGDKSPPKGDRQSPTRAQTSPNRGRTDKLPSRGTREVLKGSEQSSDRPPSPSMLSPSHPKSSTVGDADQNSPTKSED